jgi:hypothetical protein
MGHGRTLVVVIVVAVVAAAGIVTRFVAIVFVLRFRLGSKNKWRRGGGGGGRKRVNKT